MKKAVIMFLIFFVLDIIFLNVFGYLDYGENFDFYFLPVIFLEISIYGSVILYEVSKKNNNDDDTNN